MITPDPYFQIPAYSNSRLSEIRDQLRGIERPKPIKAFYFGNVIHEIVLENTHLDDYELEAKDRETAASMCEKLKKELPDELKAYQHETTHLWQDRISGLICKCKRDLFHPDQSHLIDLKTTHAWNDYKFQELCLKYEYDRQAAFYLDGSKAKRFTIIGIQKAKPFNIYRIEWTRRQKVIDNARKKYRFLLTKAKHYGLKPLI